MPSPSAAPNDIWNWPERAQTLADISFAPTSINNIEFPNDIGPIAYQANRSAMASNANEELLELEARNQQTTSYPTIPCVAGPMSPEYRNGRKCDVNAMQERAHGITTYDTNGSAILPQFNAQRALSCTNMELRGVGIGTPDPSLLPRASGEPPIGYAPNVYSKRDNVRITKQNRRNKSIPFKSIPTRTFNSVRGAIYDMKHFNQLPPAQAGASPSHVASFALTRDGRMPYLIILLTVVLAITSVIFIVRSASK